ncbi:MULTISPECIES: nicotinate (nicotinamide) nucleotide adenylyltransferase [Pedobacter]|uniref:Probable nicotinate-nucleotide adenylyltransferase n=1 Tax=Pedobacter heparinus (strain ATCC 13125 / DSM 2366 / CIP 104194 / JCM 7457 / NBRC 12017 / NCIMB 9290 / NRRL B-14731 / HIM 762-3) TaxID=485917 RepID=C6XX83_PEDHD|nr:MULTISPECIES: nicotinate (nicotinamide) nucleotide adenylyltransferase [Pedobacter]ACU06389.1 nicotinate (nicotinamide) nucleotide adenylyltransferase [Pedobacter heparinus DSM 2366]MBB5437241.1 nicotinate-nucleotide adenylyltransferase [Pedobacter sp. AK017]
MKTGLFFGSFNPIHTGHLVIAGYMAGFTELKEIWLVVSPHNPLKNKNGLSNMYDRLEMAKLATENADHIKVSDIEFNLPQPSYTIDTLTHLQEKYPGKEFALIMGADNLSSFKKWKNYEVILQHYEIYVYPRPGADISEWAEHPAIKITDTPQMDISSTFIRKGIAAGKNLQYFVPDKVLSFIDSKNMYR